MGRQTPEQQAQGTARKAALRELFARAGVPYSRVIEEAEKILKEEAELEAPRKKRKARRSTAHACINGNTKYPTKDVANLYGKALVRIIEDRTSEKVSFEERFEHYLQKVEFTPSVVPFVVAPVGSCGTLVLRYATTRMAVTLEPIEGLPTSSSEGVLCEVFARPRPAVVDVLRQPRANLPHAPAFSFLNLRRARSVDEERRILVLDGFCLEHRGPTVGLVIRRPDPGKGRRIERLDELATALQGRRILYAQGSETETALQLLIEALGIEREATLVPVAMAAPCLDLLQRGILKDDTVVAVGHTALSALRRYDVDDDDYRAYAAERGGHLDLLATDREFGAAAREQTGADRWPEPYYVLAVAKDLLDERLLRSSAQYFRKMATKLKDTYMEEEELLPTVRGWMSQYAQPGCFLSIPMLGHLIQWELKLHIPQKLDWVSPADWSL